MAARKRGFPETRSRDRFRERAETTLSLRKPIECVHKLLRSEVRPERIDEHQLGIRGLPEEEVAQSMLAAGADDQIWFRKGARKESSREEFGCDRLRIEPPFLRRTREFAGGVGNFLLAAIIEREGEIETLIADGQALGVLDHGVDIARDTRTIADDPDTHAALNQLVEIRPEVVAEESHECAHLCGRALPVFRRECVEREVSDA